MNKIEIIKDILSNGETIINDVNGISVNFTDTYISEKYFITDSKFEINKCEFRQYQKSVIINDDNLHFYNDLDDYIIKDNFSTFNHLYFISSNEYIADANQLQIIKNYFIIKELFDLIADYKHGKTYVIISDQKCEIKLGGFEYELVASLKILSESSCSRFKELIGNSSDQSKLILILKNIIVKHLIKEQTNNRLLLFFNNMNSIIDNFEVDIKIYLKQFSIDSIKEEFDKKYLSFMENINLITSKIQTDIIAIPIAFLLALSQLDFNKQDPFDNIIKLGVSLFSAFNILLLINQFILLQKLNKSIMDYKSELISLDIFSRFEKEFISLGRYATYQKSILIIISIFNIFFPLYLWISPNWTSLYNFISILFLFT